MQRYDRSWPQGIDVSHYQGAIDWHQVKADGIQFVIIKATQGTSHIDPNLKQYANGATSAGLKKTFYHYFTARTETEAAEEAQFFIHTVQPYAIDLPYALDVERAVSTYDRKRFTALVKRWLEEVERLSGTPPLFYSYPYFIETYLEPDTLTAYPLWLANYGNPQPKNVGGWTSYAILQYSDQGTVRGISGPVDHNIADPRFYDHTIRTMERLNADKASPQGTSTDAVSTPSNAQGSVPQSFDTQRDPSNDTQTLPPTAWKDVSSASIPGTLPFDPLLPIPKEKSNSQEQQIQKPLNNEKRFFFGSWCRKFFGRVLRWIKNILALFRG